MNKYTIVGIMLICAISLSCSNISGLIPQALAAETQQAVDSQKATSRDVFREIQSNITLVTNLKTKVEEANKQGTTISLDDIISQLETVANSYSDLSGQHDAIRANLIQKVTDVEILQKQVADQINVLRIKRNEYTKQLNAVTDPDPSIVATRKQALSQAITYVDDQIALWTNFGNLQQSIIGQMNGVNTTINRFLATVDDSSIVFNEALNVLRLQKNINNALSLFTHDVPEMQRLTSDMQASWANLDYLVNTLTSITNPPILTK